MAYIALMDGNQVKHLVVATLGQDLGPDVAHLTQVDVTDAEPRPTVGWTFENGVWYPDTLTGVSRTLWNGTGFDEAEEVIEVEEVPQRKSLFRKRK